MNKIKLSNLNYRDFEIIESDKRRLEYLGKSISATYEATRYLAKALGFKNIGEMEAYMSASNT